MGTYSYTGAAQFVTIQNSGTYQITAYGAAGGNGDEGGKGGEIGGAFNFAAGEKLEIIVGGAGKSGGGSAGGGGGGTFVLGKAPGATSYSLLLVGGGGGGGGLGMGFYGGAGGGPAGTGSGGAGGPGEPGFGGGGGGAGVKGRGGNGTPAGDGGYGGFNQDFGFIGGGGGGSSTNAGGYGGFGGGGGGGGSARGNSGGGGGGGYTGGAGGDVGVDTGGGGGTSFDAGETFINRSGVETGNGQVKIVFRGAICFVTGTRILTIRGDLAVEDLAIGDVAVNPAGEKRPIVWIGHRNIDCRGRHDQFPVRIAANAFGVGSPARDLYLSPGHPVLVGAGENGEGGHLVPIMCLINGTTIERVPVDTVTYWHVELDAHDILLAEGLPAESYIDLGSRAWFDGADGVLHDPDLVLAGQPGRCRPVAIDGPVVEAARRRLDQVFAARIVDAAVWPDVQNTLLALF